MTHSLVKTMEMLGSTERVLLNGESDIIIVMQSLEKMTAHACMDETGLRLYALGKVHDEQTKINTNPKSNK